MMGSPITLVLFSEKDASAPHIISNKKHENLRTILTPLSNSPKFDLGLCRWTRWEHIRETRRPIFYGDNVFLRSQHSLGAATVLQFRLFVPSGH